jgi:nucleotide-binding universal stress UspA family protein
VIAMLKDILVNLNLTEGADPTSAFARSVAATFDAHLTGIGFAYEPAVPPTIMGGIPADFVEQQRQANEALARRTVARFEEDLRRDGLNGDSRLISASLANAAERFGILARRFDLSIVGQADPSRMAVEDVITEAALFNSGRPVLVVPYVHASPLSLKKVMLCWDGGRPAARAMADALPLLKRAGKVDVVTFTTERSRPEDLPAADVAHHLARHGLTVELQRVPVAGIDIASAILSHAADTSTDLLVMGGYGHSRLREFILGGATRGILAAMTVPTLLSH